MTGLWPAIQINFKNLDDDSCLNGWGFGNIATTAMDASKFFWELLGTQNILSQKYQTIMESDFEPSTKGFKFEYALGLMPLCFEQAGGTPDYSKSCVVGHGGEDWGSHTQLAGYNSAYKYGITVAQNTVTGMNCDLKGNEFFNNYLHINDPNCLIFDLTNQFLSNGTSPKMKCTKTGDEEKQEKRYQMTKDRIEHTTKGDPIFKQASVSHSCNPLCDICYTGICAPCVSCIHNDSPACEPCYKVTPPYPGQYFSTACLDKNE